MRAVVQRVRSASVTVDGVVAGKCGRGLLVLAAAHRDDTLADALKLADRVLGLRIFADDQGKMNLPLSALPPDETRILAVSQFTLYGDTAKSRRPSFIESAPYAQGESLFNAFVAQLSRTTRVETGIFGAMMQVELVNDGPVTLIIDVGPSGGAGSLQS